MMTVSRALRGAPGVSDARRQELKKLAQKHQYTPNMIVRGIRTGLTWTAGVMLPVDRHFYGLITAGVHDGLAEAKYALLLSSMPVDYSSPGSSADLRHLMPLIERRVDGLIFRPTDDRAKDLHLEELRRRSLPFVTVDRHLPAARCDFVGSDDNLGGQLAAQHLLHLGHRHVAFLGGPNFVSTSRERGLGFSRTIARHGGRCVTLEMSDFVDGEGARRLLALRPRPTAVLCVNDYMAILLLRIAAEHGVSVPRELSVVGFANLPESEATTPRLTTINQDPRAIGREAARVLLHRIQRRQSPPTSPIQIRIPPALVVRESTAPPPRRRQ